MPGRLAPGARGCGRRVAGGPAPGDGVAQGAGLGRRLHAELAVQAEPERLVHPQGFAPLPGPGQRLHEGAVQPFVQGVVDERLPRQGRSFTGAARAVEPGQRGGEAGKKSFGNTLAGGDQPQLELGRVGEHEAVEKRSGVEIEQTARIGRRAGREHLPHVDIE